MKQQKEKNIQISNDMRQCSCNKFTKLCLVLHTNNTGCSSIYNRKIKIWQILILFSSVGCYQSKNTKQKLERLNFGTF